MVAGVGRASRAANPRMHALLLQLCHKGGIKTDGTPVGRRREEEMWRITIERCKRNE
jgi:hypothetical protein